MPSSPEGKNLKLYAGVNDKLGIALTDGTTKKILDDDDLPLSVANGGTGSTTIGAHVDFKEIQTVKYH